MYSLMEKDIIDTKQTISVSTTAEKKKKKKHTELHKNLLGHSGTAFT